MRPVLYFESARFGSIAPGILNVAPETASRLSTRSRRPAPPPPFFHWVALSAFTHGAVRMRMLKTVFLPFFGTSLTVSLCRVLPARDAGLIRSQYGVFFGLPIPRASSA